MAKDVLTSWLSTKLHVIEEVSLTEDRLTSAYLIKNKNSQIKNRFMKEDFSLVARLALWPSNGKQCNWKRKFWKISDLLFFLGLFCCSCSSVASNKLIFDSGANNTKFNTRYLRKTYSFDWDEIVECETSKNIVVQPNWRGIIDKTPLIHSHKFSSIVLLERAYIDYWF